jgi:hypothetical protein
VKTTKLDEKVVEKYNEVAKTNGAELVFPPVQFEIPAGVDPSKITTGIVFNADGTYSQVPTKVYEKDAKWYAKLNSLTNSDYSVIWNPVTVRSVKNHWAKDAVNDMASRLVIFNAEDFEPDKAITRADFAEYIVRALGLYREGLAHVFNGTTATKISPKASLTYAEAVQAVRDLLVESNLISE